jgi:translation initiation factor RLI1
MPKPIAVVNYDRCRPRVCEQGECVAVRSCPRGILAQETAYALPEPRPGACVGCGICAQACPCDAIQLI